MSYSKCQETSRSSEPGWFKPEIIKTKRNLGNTATADRDCVLVDDHENRTVMKLVYIREPHYFKPEAKQTKLRETQKLLLLQMESV